MAEIDPRAYQIAPKRDSWGFVSIPNADSELTNLIRSIQQSSDSFFSVVLLGFELVNAVLDLVASFLVDVPNPLKIVIQTILSILDSFLEDLRNAGFYVTWDSPLNDLSKLYGGYPAYQSRIIKKILNRADSTRPQFNTNTKVFAINLFAGVGVGSIEKIYENAIKPISELISIIKKDYKREIKSPIDVEVAFYRKFGFNVEIDAKYGGEESIPDGVRVKWKLPATKSTNPYFPRSFIAPSSFLVCVSTRNAGDLIGVGITRKREENEVDSLNDPTTITESLLVESPKPIKAELLPLLVHTEKRYQGLLKNGDLVKGEIKNIEPPEAVNTDASPLLVYAQDKVYTTKIEGDAVTEIYKVFSVKAGQSGFGDPNFELDIPMDILKIGGTVKDDYFVTVYSYDDEKSLVSEAVAGMNATKVIGNNGAFVDDYLFTTPFNLNIPSLSNPSTTKHIDIPKRNKNDFIKAIREFFCWFILARLSEPSARAKVFVSDPFNSEVLNQIYQIMSVKGHMELTQRLYSRAGLNRESFAQRVLNLVDYMMKRVPVPQGSFITSNRANIQTLLNSGYNLYEVLEKTSEGGDADGYFKLGLNNGLGGEGVVYNHTDDRRTGYVWEELASDFNLGNSPKYISGSLYSSSPFLRLLGIESSVQSPIAFLSPVSSVSNAGISLLNSISLNSEGKGEWINYRPFQNTDLSVFLDGLESFKRYAETLQKGIEGVVAEIIKYISLVKQRIEELRAIILKLKAVIDAILSFRFPAGIYATYHITNGTDDLVNAIVNAKNKPAIDSKGYGAGMMIVAGGLPSILTEFFIAMIAGEE